MPGIPALRHPGFLALALSLIHAPAAEARRNPVYAAWDDAVAGRRK